MRGNIVAPRAVVAEFQFAATTAHPLFFATRLGRTVTKASLLQRGKVCAGLGGIDPAAPRHLPEFSAQWAIAA
ncbi:MAG: hypothetical protein ACK4MS_07550 [Paracoccaceae bacterium]